jgi:uncharacterized membrane protein YcaP (DUF421 family)
MSLSHLFAVEVPVAELVIRGSAIYWFLFLVFRFVIRRDIGALGIADVLLLVIVSDAAQNGMSGQYQSITEGAILVSTIIGWNVLLDRLAYRYSFVGRFASPRALPLVRHGHFLHENLRREYLAPDEVMAKLRGQGIAHLRQVRHAYMESDGQISVIRYEDQAPPVTDPPVPP